MNAFWRSRLVFALVVLAALVLLVYSARSERLLAHRIPYVCVSTGASFNLTADEAGMIPARNQVTGRRTLIPCHRTENGVCMVAPRFRPLLCGALAQENHYVDLQTLVVRASSQEE